MSYESPEISCATFEARLGDYIEATLPAESSKALESHIARCERCAVLLGDMRRIPALVRWATDVAMPPLVQARLRRLLSLKHRRER